MVRAHMSSTLARRAVSAALAAGKSSGLRWYVMYCEKKSRINFQCRRNNIIRSPMEKVTVVRAHMSSSLARRAVSAALAAGKSSGLRWCVICRPLHACSSALCHYISTNANYIFILNTRSTLFGVKSRSLPITAVPENMHAHSTAVVQARSINSFKNKLDKFWSTQAIIYDYESPLTIPNGTGNYDIKIFDSEDLIMEEPTGSCDQNRHKVS